MEIDGTEKKPLNSAGRKKNQINSNTHIYLQIFFSMSLIIIYIWKCLKWVIFFLDIDDWNFPKTERKSFLWASIETHCQTVVGTAIAIAKFQVQWKNRPSGPMRSTDQSIETKIFCLFLFIDAVFVRFCFVYFAIFFLLTWLFFNQILPPCFVIDDYSLCSLSNNISSLIVIKKSSMKNSIFRRMRRTAENELFALFSAGFAFWSIDQVHWFSQRNVRTMTSFNRNHNSTQQISMKSSKFFSLTVSAQHLSELRRRKLIE